MFEKNTELVRCKACNNDGTPCHYPVVLQGYCVMHYDKKFNKKQKVVDYKK